MVYHNVVYTNTLCIHYIVYTTSYAILLLCYFCSGFQFDTIIYGNYCYFPWRMHFEVKWITYSKFLNRAFHRASYTNIRWMDGWMDRWRWWNDDERRECARIFFFLFLMGCHFRFISQQINNNWIKMNECPIENRALSFHLILMQRWRHFLYFSTDLLPVLRV